MKRYLNRKSGAIIAAVAVSLGVTGAAMAYFTGNNGSGNGSATVGTSTALQVSVGSCEGSALVPGSGSQTCGFTVTNPGPAQQRLASTSVAMRHDGSGNVYDTTTSGFVSGCQASWFDVNVSSDPAPIVLASGADVTTGTVTMTMPSDAVNNQDACQGITPGFTVTANAV